MQNDHNALKNADSDRLLERFLTLPPGKERQAEFRIVKSIAFDLGKHESTIRRWVEEGRVGAIKVLGTIYVHVPSLKELLRRSQTQSRVERAE
jgi:hypothetical protein